MNEKDLLELAKDISDNASAINGGLDDGVFKDKRFDWKQVSEVLSFLNSASFHLKDALKKLPEVESNEFGDGPLTLAEWAETLAE